MKKHKLRQYTFVKLKKKYSTDLNYRKHFKWTVNETFIFFGEIPNMKDHGIFLCDRTEKMYIGLHIENFEELTDDET